MTRRSLNKKALTSEPVTSSPRISRRSATHPINESTKTPSLSSTTPRLNSKRKHSISPVTISKRTKTDSSVKKTPSISKKLKIEDNVSEDDEPEEQNKPTVAKRKLNLDLSSKFLCFNYLFELKRNLLTFDLLLLFK